MKQNDYPHSGDSRLAINQTSRERHPPTWISDVVAAACRHWPELLAAVGIDIPPRGKHGPCPNCGGKDRFRLDDKGGRGTFICSQCGAGDGLDLVCRVMNKSLKEAAMLVAPLVGVSAGGLDPAKWEHIHQQQQVRGEVERLQGLQRRREAASRTVEIVRKSKPSQSPYLKRKGLGSLQCPLNSEFIREGGENFPPGSLVIPLTNEAAELVNVQLIRNDGTKRYLAGGQKAGAYYCIEGGELVAVVEGFATGLSVQLATGATVYCAMDCGNLPAVAAIARRQHPEAQILICGDNDESTKGNPGKAKAKQAALAVGGLVILPLIAGDWNDYHQAHGLEKTREAIMSASTKPSNIQPQAASQQDGAEVIHLHPEPIAETYEHSSPAPMIDKMSASQRAALLVERLGQVAINIMTDRVHHYDGSLWLPLADVELRREMATIFTLHEAPFSDRAAAAAVATMKLMLPVLADTSKDLIGFANGVYDLITQLFRPHDPADGLLTHNGITYGKPHLGESIERHAPNFFRWLTHAANSDKDRMDRIKAALYMVLANRYEWQLFLEVTGEGGSGKSVMANLCELLVGSENVGSSSMKRLESDFGLESVWDKRLILLPDQPRYAGDGALLKAITGGDEVPVNPKGKAIFSAKVRAVVLATNNEPMVFKERNGGIARRRVIFTFNRVVVEADKDPLLGEKIAAELPVVIRHLLARFIEPEQARQLLLAQRSSDDALSVKRQTDPVIDLCAMLMFLDEPKGMMMGGNPDAKREPRRYLYHLYLAYMGFHGLSRSLSVTAFSKAVNCAAKELGREYLTRKIKGVTQTNAGLTELVEAFLPQASSPE